MRLALVALLAPSVWGITVSSITASGVTDRGAHVRLVKSDSTTAVYLVLSTGTISNCTLDSTHLRYGSNDGSATNTPVFQLTGLTPASAYNVGVCTTADSLDHTATSLFTTSAAATQTYPSLPVLTTHTRPSSYGRTITVAANCSDLQTSLNDAADDAGASNIKVEIPYDASTCTGNYTLAARSGGGTGYIHVISTATKLPPFGARIATGDSNKMPLLQASSSASATLSMAAATSKWWIEGIEFQGTATGSMTSIVNLASGTDIVLDRVWVNREKAVANPTTWAIQADDCINCEIVNSYVLVTRSDTNHASCVWTSYVQGLNIENNYLGCPGNTVLFDEGGSGTNTNKDVRLKRNTFEWDDRFRNGSPTTLGEHYKVWQYGEIKECVRCEWAGNKFKWGWPDNEIFFASIQITPRTNITGNNNCAVAVSDVSFKYNWIENASGIRLPSLTGDETSDEPCPTERVYFGHNLFSNPLMYDSSESAGNKRTCTGCSNGEARFHHFSAGGVNHLTIENNTWFDRTGNGFSGQRWFGFICGPLGNVTFRNNIGWYANGGTGGGHNYDDYNGGCLWPDGSAPSNTTGTGRLTEFTNGLTYTSNAIIAWNPDGNGFATSTINVGGFFPNGQYFPGDTSTGQTAVSFRGTSKTSTRLQDYCLTLASAYSNRSQNGRQVGIDCGKILEEIGGVYNVGVSSLTATAFMVRFNAPAGLTGPGTACRVDVSMDSTFPETSTDTFTATVNSAITWAQSASVTGRTAGTLYYYRIHAAGEPDSVRSVTTP